MKLRDELAQDVECNGFNPKDVYKILKENGVLHLYHSNSVATSNTFIDSKSLLSREQVSSLGLYQTPQKSDQKDVLWGINDLIFLDMLDVGEAYNRPNYYGPILFCFGIEILNSDCIEEIFISKKNPIKWLVNERISDKLILDLNEYGNLLKTNKLFSKCNAHLMLKCKNGKIDIRELPFKLLIESADVQIKISDTEDKFVPITEFISTNFNTKISALGLKCEVKIKKSLSIGQQNQNLLNYDKKKFNLMFARFPKM